MDFNPESTSRCTNSINQHLEFCDQNKKMKGIINELFGNHLLNNELRIKNKKYENINVNIPTFGIYKQLIEWIDPNTKHFAIGTEKSDKTNFLVFNSTHLIGWMSNTYARWIGYDHMNKYTILDSMFVDYRTINEYLKYKLAINSKRILIQYDYVIPFDSVFTVNSYIWMNFAKQIRENIFHINVNDSNYNFSWPLTNNKLPTDYNISTRGLFKLFNETGELDLLKKVNQIDIEL
eukprot:91683_1